VSDSDSIGAWWDGIEFSSPAPGVIQHTHAAHVCSGRPCPIHNPSDHHMRDWPLEHIGKRLGQQGSRTLLLSERLCGHGVGHPDPDSLTYVISHSTTPPSWWRDHVCCPYRCCDPAQLP
jgi:hypothetical protein